MSATSSLPVDNLQNHQAGFYDQTLPDHFLPSSPSEEQLALIYNDLHPQEPHNCYQQPSTSPFSHVANRFTESSRQYTELPMGEEQAYSLGYNHATNETSTSTPYTSGTQHSFHGMSPTDTYASDYELNVINEHHAPNLDPEFLLEADFGPLDFSPEPQDPNSSQDPMILSTQDSSNDFVDASQEANHTPPRPSTLASYVSHLMSPDLTDTASLDSGYEHTSPVAKLRLLGGGVMSRLSSQSTTTTAELALPIHQRTPALTGSSLEASPEPASVPDVGRNKSPVVRIESYSRGDSPARAVGPLTRNASKRSHASRSSSHLAAPNDDSSDEEDYGTPSHNENGKPAEPSYNGGRLGARVGLNPAMRTQIAGKDVPNFKDQAEINEKEIRNADVQEWLARSGCPNEVSDEQDTPNGARKQRKTSTRRRAKSTGDPSTSQSDTVVLNSKRLAEANAHIPGPGLLLFEPSDDEYEDDDNEGDSDGLPEISSTNGDSMEVPGSYFTETPGESSQTLDAHPWIDPIYFPSHQDHGDQPITSNSAMMNFEKRAKELEPVSRRATWATSVRRLSETDLDKILGPEGLFSRLSVSRDKIMEKVDRRGSSLAAKLLPKRTSGTLKRKTSEPTGQKTDLLIAERRRHESLIGSLGSVQETKDSLQGRKEDSRLRTDTTITSGNIRRMPSASKRPRSPKLNTSEAMVAMTNQIAALGGNGSLSPTANPSSAGLMITARNVIRRRPRGDSYRAPAARAAEPGLADLWIKQGGPPLPTLASPPEEPKSVVQFGPTSDDEEDAETDEMTMERGVSMNFTPKADGIIPTKDGFQINVQEVNPRLAPYLVDRLGQEQLRRYKKLISFKLKHVQSIQNRTCESGKNCLELGGEPSYLPSKASKKEIELSHTGFSVTTKSEAEANALPEGVVTQAQFPQGVPMPPVQRLPAEFECDICFTVKKIQKPSDWSKHVHEDLQPFTCTFQDCSEPKSFKRKADWVRHENERHRQLEWWTCSMPDCMHKCHRRDNFVQHLVREHKLTELNAKSTKASKVRGPAKTKSRSKASEDIGSSEDEISRLVVACRSETTSKPQDEPCRFCGNVCNSWKKLTVHLARHMEQISIPVLDLARQKDVTPDSIISPIEQNNISQAVDTLPITESHLVGQTSTDGLLYHVPPKMVDVKQELPGSFVPLHVPAFHSPPRENQVSGNFPWGHLSSPSTQVQTAVPSLTYAPDMNAAYAPAYNYGPPGGSQFLPINAQINHPPNSPTSKPDLIYGEMRGLPANVQTSYPNSPPYPIAMSEHQTPPLPYNASQHVDQNGFPIHGSQGSTRGMAYPLQFSPQHGMSYGPDTNDSARFGGQSQQYFPY